MEAKRFDALTRWLTTRADRREIGLFGGTTFGGIVAAATGLDAEGKKRKKRKKRKRKKKCQPCRARKKGKCKKRKPDWTPCGGGKVCQRGSCVEAVCAPPCNPPESCVTGKLHCPLGHTCEDRCCPEPISRTGNDCFCGDVRCTCPQTAVLLAAGDIAACDTTRDGDTAKLLDEIVDEYAGRPEIEVVVAPLGDTAYQNGTPAEFANCYHPTWGRHWERTRPALGDHEYNTPGASGYFCYFGSKAGPPDRGYYSYDLGTWHIVVLNTNCTKVGGCGPNSPQVQWLRTDLEEHPAACTLAVIHHPRFSSGARYGSNDDMRHFWQALYDAGADIVLSGNEHNYERFAPQTPSGTRDHERGIRQFVVGTGGIGHYPIGNPIANSEVHNDRTWGILKLTLRPGAYDWRFVPIKDHSFTDAGSGVCNAVGGTAAKGKRKKRA